MPRADEITRVRYFERQFLGAVDFRAEQLYDRDARRRHVLAHHTWGIIVGLELVELPIVGETDFVDVLMQTGAAIDGFGRELVAYHPVRLDAAAFDAFHTDAHQSVWLAYEEDEAGAARYGFADCQDGAATRITEGWRIVVSPTPPETDDIIVDGAAASPPPAPQGTPEIPADLSVPYQELPEEPPGDRWLIRLGTVHWDGTQQRFRPAAAGRLNEERRYVGAIADHLLTPARTLSVRQRTKPADVDAEDFAKVEGRLRVQGRINAEKEVWVEGDRIRFTYDTGDEEGTELTLGRERPAGNALGHRLRLRLGEPNDDATWLTIGPGEAAAATDVVRVRASDVVEVPTGTLTFGAQTRQMLDLWSTAGKHEFGIGIQTATLYFRTVSSFSWFKGGVHADAALDPGAGGQLQMQLDGDAHLHVSGKVSTGDDLTVGAGGDAKVVTRHIWGKGSGNDSVDNLYLNWNNGRDVVIGRSGGPTSDLIVSGDLRVEGDLPSVIRVVRRDVAVQNQGIDQPRVWTEDFSGDFSELYEAFVVLNGFSILENTTIAFDNVGREKDTDTIVQHVYARVTGVVGTSVSLTAFCAQSDENLEDNNSMLLTIVAIGRQL